MLVVSNMNTKGNNNLIHDIIMRCRVVSSGNIIGSINVIHLDTIPILMFLLVTLKVVPIIISD